MLAHRHVEKVGKAVIDDLVTQHDPRDTPHLDRAGVQALFRCLRPPVQIAYAISSLAGHLWLVTGPTDGAAHGIVCFDL